MAKQILTDKVIRDLEPPKSGMAVIRDGRMRGLGVRILPSGTRSFVLDYSVAGRRRIFTIGTFPAWGITAARAKAGELQNRIRHEGFDPAQELQDAREAPDIADLAERFRTDHLPKLRLSTRGDYERMLKNDILPAFGNRKVASIQFEDVAKLHREITGRGSPMAANFVVALTSKLFSYAVQLRMIDRNPAKGVERNPARPRSRYLSPEEIGRLTKALAEYHDQDWADLFRLLLLTGARQGETRSATWDQFNLNDTQWVKPSHATKQKRDHHLPLAAPARALLGKRRFKADAMLKAIDADIATAAPADRLALQEWRRRVETFVFPARGGKSGHVMEPKKPWDAICKEAGIINHQKITDAKGQTKTVERTGARIHDLRHTAASVLASSGASLPLIGSLLGHSQAATTARYAHLFDDALKGAVEKLGATITGAEKPAEIITLNGQCARKR